MSAYKKINRQDTFLTKYRANKEYQVSGSQLESYGLVYEVIPQFTGSTYYLDLQDESELGYKPLVYKSLEQLYYRSFNEDEAFITSNSYEHYLSTSLLESNTRKLEQDLIYLSIPRKHVGVEIWPGSFRINLNTDTPELQTLYIDQGYIADLYFLDLISDLYFSVGDIIDTKEGSLLFKHPTGEVLRVGDILYSHGIVIITYKPLVDYLKTVQLNYVSWKSTVEVLTQNIHIKIKDSEYLHTLNPSAIDRDGNLQTNLQVGSFTPYITTIGLYNNAQELIATAKVPYPVPKSAETEMSIIIQLDNIHKEHPTRIL